MKSLPWNVEHSVVKVKVCESFKRSIVKDKEMILHILHFVFLAVINWVPNDIFN